MAYPRSPPRIGASSPRAARRRETYDRSVTSAPSGGSPAHSSSMSRPVPTVIPGSSARSARRARIRGPPMAPTRPPRAITTGPRSRISRCPLSTPVPRSPSGNVQGSRECILEAYAGQHVRWELLTVPGSVPGSAYGRGIGPAEQTELHQQPKLVRDAQCSTMRPEVRALHPAALGGRARHRGDQRELRRGGPADASRGHVRGGRSRWRHRQAGATTCRARPSTRRAARGGAIRRTDADIGVRTTHGPPRMVR